MRKLKKIQRVIGNAVNLMASNPHRTVDLPAGGVLDDILAHSKRVASVAAMPACVLAPKPQRMSLPTPIARVDIDLRQVAPLTHLTQIAVTLIQTLVFHTNF